MKWDGCGRKKMGRKARCVGMDNYTYTNGTMQPQGCTWTYQG